MKPSLDIVVPVYNEQEALSLFHATLMRAVEALDYSCRVIYINDGSTDATQQELEALAAIDRQVEVIELSRNFGHQSALSAGLDVSSADWVITMDGDGQHPPEMLAEMLAQAQAGYDIVLTQRMEQEEISAFKRLTSATFYRVINRMADTRINPGSADFRLMSRRAVDALCAMPEYHRFLRGMVSWLGFKTVILPFEVPERLAGKSKYSLKKMLRLATDAVFSFSLAPLYVGVSIGGLFLVLALIEAIYVLSFWVTGNTSNLAPGWSSLMFVLLVVGGTLMILLGFIGVYIGYIFQEVKRRPVYVVRSHTGGDFAANHQPE